ncbi:hypothetical protein ACFL2E_12570 [Thermodesulfobacteriota bacterium]
MLMNVLFIGNSHTYLNYMPRMLSGLVTSEDRGFELAVGQCTGEGADLAWHWENSATRNTFRKKTWDYVVLQDRSGGPLEELDSFVRHAELLDAEIRKLGAKTMLFLTWANRSRPDTQAVLADAYEMTAHKLHTALAPVGLAWEAIHRIDPGFELYHRDGRHANPMGSYLTACVFYAVIFDTSPEGLPGSFYFKGKIWVDLEKDRASLLQKTAWETVSNLRAL